MPAARNWIIARGGKAQHHIPDYVFAGHLCGAVNLKRSIAVMQKCHIRWPQRGGNGCVPFMAGAANRVIALAAFLQIASGAIELAAGHLRNEDFTKLGFAKARLFSAQTEASIGKILRVKPGQKLLMHMGCAVYCHSDLYPFAKPAPARGLRVFINAPLQAG